MIKDSTPKQQRRPKRCIIEALHNEQHADDGELDLSGKASPRYAINLMIEKRRRLDLRFIQKIEDALVAEIRGHLSDKLLPSLKDWLWERFNLAAEVTEAYVMEEEKKYDGGNGTINVDKLAAVPAMVNWLTHHALEKLITLKYGTLDQDARTKLPAVVQIPCSICNNKTQWYCKGCYEDGEKASAIPLCGGTSHRDCYLSHMKQHAAKYLSTATISDVS